MLAAPQIIRGHSMVHPSPVPEIAGWSSSSPRRDRDSLISSYPLHIRVSIPTAAACLEHLERQGPMGSCKGQRGAGLVHPPPHNLASPR